jgi:hypothetical protein
VILALCDYHMEWDEACSDCQKEKEMIKQMDQELTQGVKDIQEFFRQLKNDKAHHLGSGDIRLSLAQQDLVAAMAFLPSQERLTTENELERLSEVAWAAGRACGLLKKIKLESYDVFTIAGLGDALADLERALKNAGVLE